LLRACSTVVKSSKIVRQGEHFRTGDGNTEPIQFSPGKDALTLEDSLGNLDTLTDGIEAGLAEDAVGGAAWSVAAVLANRLLSTAVFVILSRLLAPKAFGVVALASVAVVILQAIAESGLGRALVRLPVLTEKDTNTAFWASTVWAALLATTLAAMSGPLASAFGDHSAAPILAAMSTALLLTGLQSVQLGLLSRRMQFRQMSLREVAGAVGGAVVGVGMATLGCGAWALVGQLLATQLLSVAALWFVSDWRPRFQFDWSRLRFLVSYGSSFSLTSLSGTLQRNMDNLIVGTFLGVIQLGYYSVAYRVFLLLCSLTVDATINISLPTFSKLVENPRRFLDAYYRAVGLSCRVTLPAFLFLAVEGSDVVTLLSGQRWLPAGRILIALCPAGILLAITTFDGGVLFALGRLRSVVIITIATTIITVGAFLIGVQFGAAGVGAGYGAGLLAMWPLRIYLVRAGTHLSLRTYFSRVGASVAMCLPMAIGLWLFRVEKVLGNGWAHMLLAGAVSLALYVPVVLRFDRETVDLFRSSLLSAVRSATGRESQ
jgi:PST family polysaccharide transporter